jgi:AhpD family alkylhydroperoxidase
MNDLKKLPKLAKNAPEAMKAFWAYDKAALTDGAVPKEHVELMAGAVALTTQSVYCIEIHRKSALESIATEADLREAIHVATALRAGAAITRGTRLLEP